jgi:hypothetical protein
LNFSKALADVWRKHVQAAKLIAVIYKHMKENVDTDVSADVDDALTDEPKDPRAKW